MTNPCHVIGSKHTVYFARDKIKLIIRLSDALNFHDFSEKGNAF